MSKAYLTGPRPIKLANGATLRNGQIIGGDPMQKNPQRGLNTAYNVARDGAPKRIVDAAPVPGQRRQTTGDLHPYLHGQTVDDEVPEKSFGTAAPIHPATPSRKDRGQHVEGLGSVVLTEAANLGRKA
jgi:hypothetical protein